MEFERNPTLDALCARKSVRVFTEEPVPQAVKNALFQAAMQAPTAGNQMLYTILDITDAITAHKALDEQEKLLRNIIQNAPVGIEIYNDRGRLIDINTCDLEMFGVKDPGKIRGLNLFDNPNFPEETKIRI